MHTVGSALAQLSATLLQKGNGISFPAIARFVQSGAETAGACPASLHLFKCRDHLSRHSLGAAALSVRTNEEIYPNVHEIDSFQVFRLRDKEGDDVLAARHQLVTTSTELLGFGIRQRAW